MIYTAQKAWTPQERNSAKIGAIGNGNRHPQRCDKAPVTLSEPRSLETVSKPTPLSEFRAHLQTCESSGWAHFDDVAFKIAAGGLALSLTLLGVTKINPASIKWVFAAWISWGLTLLILLLSIVTAQLGLRAQIGHIDAGDYYETKRPQGIGVLTPWLNWFAVGTCTLGLVLLIRFALMNLPGK